VFNSSGEIWAPDRMGASAFSDLRGRERTEARTIIARRIIRMVRSRLFKIASHQITPLTGRSSPFWRRAAPSPCRPQKQTSSLSGLGRHWDVPHRSSPAPSPGSSRPVSAPERASRSPRKATPAPAGNPETRTRPRNPRRITWGHEGVKKSIRSRLRDRSGRACPATTTSYESARRGRARPRRKSPGGIREHLLARYPHLLSL